MCVSSNYKLDHFAGSRQKQFLYWSSQWLLLQHTPSSGCISKLSRQQRTARKSYYKAASPPKAYKTWKPPSQSSSVFMLNQPTCKPNPHPLGNFYPLTSCWVFLTPTAKYWVAEWQFESILLKSKLQNKVLQWCPVLYSIRSNCVTAALSRRSLKKGEYSLLEIPELSPSLLHLCVPHHWWRLLSPHFHPFPHVHLSK